MFNLQPTSLSSNPVSFEGRVSWVNAIILFFLRADSALFGVWPDAEKGAVPMTSRTAVEVNI